MHLSNVAVSLVAQVLFVDGAKQIKLGFITKEKTQ